MIAYEFASIDGFESGTSGHIICTNPNELDNLVKDLRNLETLVYEPEYHKKLKLSIERHANASPFNLYVHEIGKIDIARWWLVNWFCEHGWEPFSHYDSCYSFKRIKDQD